jgi:DNA (cytosine-5)-methyltransferase 3A
MEPITVISLFDGMSCAQQALERAHIAVKSYYASEIDKYAIVVTQANYPNTIQLGSVVDIDPEKLPFTDFLCGGSPCQSFSFAGKRKGMSTKDEQEILTLDRYMELKAEGYEFEGQSYLFWEYMRILTALRKRNPNIKFLLENVVMGEKWEKILSRAIGVNPIKINSALVSAQNRERLYWTNIGMRPLGLFDDMQSIIIQPKDKNIFLKDIIQSNVDQKYFLTQKALNGLIRRSNSHKERGNGFGFDIKEMNEKSNTILSRSYKDGKENLIKIDINGRPKANQNKASCFTAGAHSGGNHSDMDLIVCVAMRGRNIDNPNSRESGLPTQQIIEPRSDNKTNCLTTVQKDNLLEITDGVEYRIRRLTPVECERLQTVKDNYTNHVSDTQRYKMLGNGWNIDTILHLLTYYWN